MRPRLLALALAAALSGVASPARAFDPLPDWHTVETPHFSVHYHEGLGELAQRVARALEAAHQRLSPLLAHEPARRVDVVLSDETDSANGSASAWMRPVVQLYAVPPDSRSELNDYEDYVWNLVSHEYTHILHMDEVGGIPSVVNAIVGQVWVPNGINPRWLIEGLAVFEESLNSGSGRERSSIYDMMLRTEVLEHAFFAIDDVSGSPSVWPRGALPYLHGSRFMQWIADTHGIEPFTAISHDYGSQFIPFALNSTAKDHLGATYIDLYKDWQKAVTEQYEQQLAAIRQRGASEPVRLTFRGEDTGEPVFLGNERLLYVEDSADRRAALRRVGVDGRGDEAVRELYSGGTLAVSRDGAIAVVSQMVAHRQFYLYEDLFKVDLKSGALDQLTFGARLTEPELSPDGKTIIAAQRLDGGRSALVSLPVCGGELRVLYRAPERHVVFTPRYSRDGSVIAFSEQRPEGRDIRLLHLDDGRFEDVTNDRSLDLDPVFDPSGRWLLWSSDRTGVYNVFGRDLTTGETRQVTNVLTGAFKPQVSPDGKRLAFVTYSRIGYDVAVLPFAPEGARLAAPDTRERPPPPQWETRELYPVKPYRPWETLRPLYWLPVLGSDPEGLTLGITTAGGDVVGKHAWALQAGIGLSSKQPSVEASWSTQLFYPDLDLNAGTYIASVPGAPDAQIERQYHGSASLNFPFTHLDQSYAVSLGYELRYYAPWATDQPALPDGVVPFRADSGLAATLSLGLGFSNAQGFANGISPERGISLWVNLRGARPEWGSQFRYAAVEAALTKYLAMPWLEHHALALRLAGGASTGDLGNRRVFGLGGIGPHDPLLDLLQSGGASGAALRGYAPGAFAGSFYALGNAEYRFPIVRIDSGLWTLPIYVRRLHAAVTCDVGEAAESWSWRGLKPSVGGELRAELYLGYALGTTLRLGYARGLASEGVNDLFLTLGSSY